MDPSSRHALLGALLLLAPAVALPCANGPAGHVHLFARGQPGTPHTPIEMGRCVGGPPRPVDANSPPAGLRARNLADKDLDSLLAAGYRADLASDRLLARDGAPVTVQRLDRLMETVDASVETIDYMLWSALQVYGYRLEESSCRLVHPADGPLIGHALELFREQFRRSNEHNALETLKAGLRGLPPGAPVPPELIARLRAMEGAQVRLPEELRRRLFAEGAVRVADLSRSLDEAYLDSTRFFDGLRDTKSFLVSTLAPGVPGSTPARAPSRISSDERTLGEMISRELEAVFARNAPGRELLEHFRQPDGTTRLPPIMVLKLNQRADDPNQPGAIYDHETRQVVFNHWTMARVLLDQAPPEKRAELAKRFADAAELRRYLADNPSARTRLMESIDYLVLHEFVHYRQGDRSRVWDEMRRGNVPGQNSLSTEHEAHRQECRYFLARVADDPGLISRGYGYDRQEYCPTLLDDPSILENRVTDLYMKTFGGFQTLNDLPGLQQARREQTLDLVRTGTWRERFHNGLRLLGLRHGDAALRHERRRIAAERAEFDRAMGELRPHAARVPLALLREGRLIAALQFLQRSGPAVDKELSIKILAQAAHLVETRDTRSTRDERLFATGLIQGAGQEVGADFLSPPVLRAYITDGESVIAELRKRAEGLSGPDAETLAASLKSWEESVALTRSMLAQKEPPPEPPATTPVIRRRAP